MAKIQSSMAVYDYSRKKLCDLYDSQNNIHGQAYGIKYITNMKDGIKQLSFSIPYMVEKDKNFRWNYLKNEYLILFTHGNIKEWFIANKPSKSKTQAGIIGTVTCNGKEAILKTKNIYKEFDDDNGIGTISELIDQILAGTGWTRGYTDPMLEEDGVTEKIRSLSSSGKKGALDLIATTCNLFKCYPVYKSDTNVVELYSYNNRDQVIEGRIGKNLESITVNPDSSDIITRLYVEGEYGDNGYVGIDSVNPTGLNYILNFDYYRKLGLMTHDHEVALAIYLEDITAIKRQIEEKQAQIITKEDNINGLIGQCAVSVYYTSKGFVNPAYTYGDPTDAQKTLSPGDTVLILQTNKQYRKEVIVTNAQSLIKSGDYGIVKFGTPSAGTFGAGEVGIEAKEKQIETLERKISQTTKPDKIAEYNAEIAALRSGIALIYSGTSETKGLYAIADDLFKENGYIADLSTVMNEYNLLLVHQDETEATFIAAMGDLLRDGYWSNTNYIPGQEPHLYADAVEIMNQLSRPTVSYKFSFTRTNTEDDINIEDIKLNAIFRVDDEELETDDNLFVTKITIGIDDESSGNIEVSNKDITISTNDLGSILSRMSQLADLIDQKNTLYDRAAAITKNKTLYTDRLNGQINVLTNQILSTVSNWYTDEQGNIIFLSADGASAMMLSGAGFMIANQKDENDQWIWRTFGTGEGFTADEIVAGFISAERIEAGSIATSKLEPDAGNKLIITGNPAITELYNQIAPPFSEETDYSEGDYVNYNGKLYMFINDHPAGPWNSEDVASTSVTTVIELLPDMIIQYVSGQGYSKTYVQLTDPTLDPDKNVTVGDYWVVPEVTWDDLRKMTWSQVYSNGTKQWRDYNISTKIYYWDGTKWKIVTDRREITTAFTRITQTQDMIQQEAERANASFIAKTSQLQTADQIITEAVRQAASGAGENYIAKTETYQTADAIVTDAVRQSGEGAATLYLAKTSTYDTVQKIIDSAQTMANDAAISAKNASIARTNVYQTAESIVNTAVAAVDNTPVFSTTTAYSVGNRVIYNGKIYEFTTAHPAGAWNANHVKLFTASNTYLAKTSSYQTADQIVTEAVRQAGVSASGAYLAKTSSYQTADQIVTTAQTYTNTKLNDYSTTTQTSTMISNYVTSNAYKIQSGITITAAGIGVSGSKYVNISSGGSFKVESDTFTLDSTNKVMDMKFLQTSSDLAVGSKIDKSGIHVIGYQDYNQGGTWSQNLDLTITTQRIRNTSLSDEIPVTSSNQLYIYAHISASTIAHSKGSCINIQLIKSTTRMSSNTYSPVLSIANTIDRFKYDDNNQIFKEWSDYPEFKENYTYSAGTLVRYDYNIYQFNTSHSPGPWDSSQVSIVADGLVSYIGPAQQKHCWCLGRSDRIFHSAYITTVHYTTLTRLSSIEYKKNIHNMEDMGSIIDQLRPVTFQYKQGNVRPLEFGLIYEDTIKYLPEICTDGGGQKGIDYTLLIPILLKETQQLRKRIKELEEKTK